MTAQLFFLLPEYRGIGNPTSVFVEKDRPMNDAELQVFLRKLKCMVLYLKDETVECFYDNHNLSAFLSAYNPAQKEYPSVKRFNLELMERNLERWRDTQEQDTVADKFYYEGQQIANDTLCEIAKRQYNNRAVMYFVINYEALNVGRDSQRLHVVCNRREKVFTALRADVMLVLRRLCERGVIKRMYHPNTAKHGTSGLGGSQADDASSLRCSNKKAKKMMGKAVKVGKHLYYFDEDENLYIRFMSGENSTFHPYHIESAQDEEKNVPQMAKTALKLHLGDFRSNFE